MEQVFSWGKGDWKRHGRVGKYRIQGGIIQRHNLILMGVILKRNVPARSHFHFLRFELEAVVFTFNLDHRCFVWTHTAVRRRL